MKNKIIYIMKDQLHSYPPCISQIVILRKLGIEVNVITEICEEKAIRVLTEAGAKIKILGQLRTKSGIIGRIEHWLKFKIKALKEVNDIYLPNDVIWFGTERTAMVIGKHLKSRKSVLNVLELYEKDSIFGKQLKKIIYYSNVVVACEINRARIMKIWYKLKELPQIMPNKPYYELVAEKDNSVTELEKKLAGKDYILYQGILNKERPLDTLAEALNKTKKRYTLVIIGNSSSEELTHKLINDLSKKYSDIVYGGYFPAPLHMHITKNAHIGVAIYDAIMMNTMFCAPNKTFEYAKYGIPIIGTDVPGLQLSIEKFNAGICIDIENPAQIAEAIDEIEDNYTKYSNGANNFYSSTDNIDTMKKILQKLGYYEDD